MRHLIALVLLLAAPVAPATARVVVVGDSNAVGVRVAPWRTWPRLLERRLHETVQVFGAAGRSLRTFDGGAPCLDRMNSRRDSVDIDVLIVALGTNDAQTDLLTVSDSLKALLYAVPKARWACLLPPLVVDGYWHKESQVAPVREHIRATCLILGAVVIDTAGTIGPRELQPDGVHLNERGHRILSEQVAELIRNWPEQPAVANASAP